MAHQLFKCTLQYEYHLKVFELKKYRFYVWMITSQSLDVSFLSLQKHHYRELEMGVRVSLGKLPDGFITYWISRFPLLLPHVWLQMQQYRHEDILQAYYPHSFTFNRDDVPELCDDEDYIDEVPIDVDPEENGLFLKSRVYYDEKDTEKRFYKQGSPKKRPDWRSEQIDYRTRQDDVRMRDRHYKKEKKKEEVPVWSIPQ